MGTIGSIRGLVSEYQELLKLPDLFCYSRWLRLCSDLSHQLMLGGIGVGRSLRLS